MLEKHTKALTATSTAADLMIIIEPVRYRCGSAAEGVSSRLLPMGIIM